MRTVSMKEFRGGGMNDEYGMSGMAREYQRSGKMPKKLVEYFERKNKEKEYAMGGAYKEYQGSGRASSSDYSDYRVFKEEGQPAQYFVRTDDGFAPAGTFRDLRAQLGDEGAANVISQFGLKPKMSDAGEFISYSGTGEEFGRASDAFARELAGRKEILREGDMPRTEYGDDFLDFVYGQQSDFKNFGGFDDILGVTDLPTDPASQRMLAKRYMDLQKGGEGVSYRDFARQVLGMGTGGGQGGR
jgi:hypothetical protein|tara:strand:+ start:672 stop:1403 length:732 start_codon:yes stop_codon:yes gene_type:complete